MDQQFEDRIARLERARWRERLILGAVAAVALLAGAQGVRSSTPQDLTARRITILGPDGSRRIFLDAQEDSTTIGMYGPSGAPGVFIGANRQHSAIFMHDPVGATNVGMLASTEFGSRLEISRPAPEATGSQAAGAAQQIRLEVKPSGHRSIIGPNPVAK